MLINERTTIRLPWPDLFPLFPSTTAQLIYPSTFTFHFLTYPLLTPSPAFLLHVSPYYLHFPFSPPSTSLLLPKISAASPRHSPSPSPSLSPQSLRLPASSSASLVLIRFDIWLVDCFDWVKISTQFVWHH